jgi:broad specificity phosphatase PhoE
MKTTVYLVRHGRTDWNDQGKYQGSSDIPLNTYGLKEAVDVGHELSSIPFTAIYSSPLKRAARTAEEIAKHHNISIQHIPELKERSYGEFEGLTFKEIELHPAFVRSKREGWYLRGAPEGETFEQAVARVGKSLDAIVGKHRGETIGIVAHGGVIKSIGYHIGHLTTDIVPKALIANARPIIIEYSHVEGSYSAVDFPISLKK